ncbi:MAG: MFS transporter [Terricaulis sp.]
MGILPRLHLSSRALMAWGAALVAAGVVVQMLAPSLGALLVSQVIQGLGFGLARPGFTGGASMAVRSDEQGPVAGLVVAMNGAGFIFSPLAGGVAYDVLGMNAPLWISLAVLTAMLVFALRSRRLRALPTEAVQTTISEV